jgi:cob(I)alamin adenosyltransferase
VDPKPFHAPHVALNRIYTKTGDAGQTSLVGGQRVPKNDPRIEALGAVDELNACVGLASVSCAQDERLSVLAAILRRVQHELFNLGSILATDPADVRLQQPRVTTRDVEQLEREIDEMNAALPPLRSFVLPGGNRLNAELHLARTVCRRAERILVAQSVAQSYSASTMEAPPLPSLDLLAIPYLNRLSDALFVWSRWANHVLGVEEILWQPNESASGR